MKLKKSETLADHAWYYFENREFEKSIDDYRAALHYDSENTTCLINLGVALVGLERAGPEAFECFNRALQIVPNLDSALVNRGGAYKSGGELEKAKADFEAVSANVNSRPEWVKTAVEKLTELPNQMSTKSLDHRKPVVNAKPNTARKKD